MKFSVTTVNMIIAPALRCAIEEYMKYAATCAASGVPQTARQFLQQADEAKKLLQRIEDRE